MPVIFARQARLADGWAANLRLRIDGGVIAGMSADSSARAGDILVDTLLPAIANLHSHSFQRAMAGRAERRVAGKDDFWAWRRLIYAFTRHLTPEHIEAIAALAFMEMQEAGFGAVGEFHYLHHQHDGTPYDMRAELSARIFAAAAQTGIGLTHLPVLYCHGGAGAVALGAAQRRFGNDIGQYLALVDSVRALVRDHLPGDSRVGLAPHSLRATTPELLAELLESRADAPVHIHIAEQPQEVTDIKAWLGAPPVQWLLENCPVDHNWCLIHATHMSGSETRALAGSGAVAGLCPITEANLGDGAFRGAEYLGAGGVFGIGSDSNLRISAGEELRMLEYSQRLRDLGRNVMIRGAGSVGAALYLAAARGGAQALGRNCGRIESGALADLVAVDSSAPALVGLQADQLLDGLVFAAGNGVVTELWSAGRHQVRGGRHIARTAIIERYRHTVASLAALI